MFFYLGFQRRIFPRTCFLERYRFCVFFISFNCITIPTIWYSTGTYKLPVCLQYRICMLFSFLSEIHSKKMVYPLPFCTSGIRFSVYAKYMYFKDELYIRIATFEINNRNNDDLRYCYIYLYSHQADNCHSKRTHHLEKKIQRINIWRKHFPNIFFNKELLSYRCWQSE